MNTIHNGPGVREIEICSFVPPKLLPQFADAQQVVRGALAIENLRVSALVPNLKGEIARAGLPKKFSYAARQAA